MTVQVRAASELDDAVSFDADDRLIGVVGGLTKQVTPALARTFFAETFNSRAEFLAATIDAGTTTVRIIDGEDDAIWVRAESDMSGELLDGSQFTSSAIDTVNNEVDVAAWSGNFLGDPLYVVSGNADIATGTIVYMSRGVRDYDKFQLHTTYDDAMDGTNVIDLTATDNITFDMHRDPLQRIGIINSGEALDGSDGAWMRKIRSGFMSGVEFGCDHEAADNSEKYQAWVNWLRTSWNVGLAQWMAHGDGKGYSYACARSINHRAATRQGLIFKNSGVHSDATGKPVHDFSGCKLMRLENLSVDGDDTNAPSIGFLWSRVHTEATAAARDAASSYSMATSNSNKARGLQTSGAFTQLAMCAMSADLLDISDSYFSNNYLGSAGTTSAGYVGGTSAGADNHLGGVVSEFHDIITSDDAADGIGTVTRQTLTNCSFRRPRKYQMTVASASLSGTELTLTVGSGEVAAAGISNDQPFNITSYNQSVFQLPPGNYTYKEISGDTFKVGTADGTGLYDATGVSGSTSTAKVTNATGPALIIGGHQSDVNAHIYTLAYNRDSILIDLDDGDINILNLNLHQESGTANGIRVAAHASADRSISLLKGTTTGDLTGLAHISIGDEGGDVYLHAPEFKIGHNQAGTSNYPNAELIGGDKTKVHLKDVNFVVAETDQNNLGDTFASAVTGRLYDIEAGTVTTY